MFKKSKKEGSGKKGGGGESPQRQENEGLAVASRLKKVEAVHTEKDKADVIAFLGRVQKKREKDGGSGRNLVEGLSVDSFPSGLADGLGLLSFLCILMHSYAFLCIFFFFFSPSLFLPLAKQSCFSSTKILVAKP